MVSGVARLTHLVWNDGAFILKNKLGVDSSTQEVPHFLCPLALQGLKLVQDSTWKQEVLRAGW